ncbi:DUF3795 domain-containing protein [Thiospirochaeta perfilievii]|uniref:DUF3795 domain-containing protein n=1 Tax=Thiospirochaeta perfilievii TaxID=252967 RepID=A0A5C1QCC2_9SPIO|nr:DUF3795 domain-containing protein [Thiospirochaeta perfilievii]
MEITNSEEMMIAVCGMNCIYCYVHHKKKKPCLGCRQSDKGKPEHCQKCKIKECAYDKGLLFCSECSDYPCILIRRLDKSYRIRYNESLINNMKVINEKGMNYYLSFEKERLKCPECSGVHNIHQKTCSECGKTFKVSELK